MPVINMDTDNIEAYCKCGEGLCSTFDEDTGHITIAPCETCTDEATSEGHRSGYDDGREDGYSTGYSNGYDEGHDVGYDEGVKEGSE